MPLISLAIWNSLNLFTPGRENVAILLLIAGAMAGVQAVTPVFLKHG